MTADSRPGREGRHASPLNCQAPMDDLHGWIRLTKTGASARRLNRLLDYFGSPEALFAAPAAEVASVARCTPKVASQLLDPAYAAGKRDFELMQRMEARLIPRSDPGYPRLLREISDPPVALYVRGELRETDWKAVAIVGSRRCSDYGTRLADRFARELVEAGVVVVSGLARGIDTAAHRGAVQAGGRTIACLGCGVDVVYPSENRGLATQVAGSGAVVSEYPMNAPPDAWHFPSRNRIISGLSLGVVVLEAPVGSGALITTQTAVDQNREVFAVPGNIENFRNRGPHALIKDGAKLVETVEDILSELRLDDGHAQLGLDLEPEAPAPPPELSGDEVPVYALLDTDPKAVDDLILEAELPAGRVTAALLMLEVKGLARRLAGNAYVRVA